MLLHEGIDVATLKIEFNNPDGERFEEGPLALLTEAVSAYEKAGVHVELDMRYASRSWESRVAEEMGKAIDRQIDNERSRRYRM